MSRTIIAVVDDLFFASKIRGTGAQVGTRIVFTKSIRDALEHARSESPDLIVVDLNAGCCDPIELARALKAEDPLNAIPLLGFFSHVDVELQRRAKEAGFDQTVPRSVFAASLTKILADVGEDDSRD